MDLTGIACGHLILPRWCLNRLVSILFESWTRYLSDTRIYPHDNRDSIHLNFRAPKT